MKTHRVIRIEHTNIGVLRKPWGDYDEEMARSVADNLNDTAPEKGAVKAAHLRSDRGEWHYPGPRYEVEPIQ